MKTSKAVKITISTAAVVVVLFVLACVVLLLGMRYADKNWVQYDEYHTMASSQSEVSASVNSSVDTSSFDNRVYIPILSRYDDPSILGYEMASDSQARRYTSSVDPLGAATVRVGIPWVNVEKNRGLYVWPMDDHVDSMFDDGNRIIGILNNPPQWAMESPGCSPVADSYYNDWLSYVRATVVRYGDRIEVWEVFNEADAPVSPEIKGWGCWGKAWQLDQGGTAYGKFVKVTADLVHSIQPDATVISGGLLLGCNVAGEFGTCTGASLVFLANALPEMKDSIDGVGFHSYTFWNGSPPINAAYLVMKIEALSRITDIPLWNTEGGFLCHSTVPAEQCKSIEYQQAQADFVHLWARTCREYDLRSCVWYSLGYNGWQYADLHLSNGMPNLAYYAMKEELAK